MKKSGSVIHGRQSESPAPRHLPLRYDILIDTQAELQELVVTSGLKVARTHVGRGSSGRGGPARMHDSARAARLPGRPSRRARVVLGGRMRRCGATDHVSGATCHEAALLVRCKPLRTPTRSTGASYEADARRRWPFPPIWAESGTAGVRPSVTRGFKQECSQSPVCHADPSAIGHVSGRPISTTSTWWRC